ncbi:MAG: hypothetical protein A3B29_02100 [Candidatus Sungbacteria bacterium RIFCSPLOWO2_01_FULL_51_34]|nr:MAG: hypothetical protein A3B29_02100 [Candidatus Sungbacteria bacterium RIFCSPLOWO2_01_FULL_51_34]
MRKHISFMMGVGLIVGAVFFVVPAYATEMSGATVSTGVAVSVDATQSYAPVFDDDTSDDDIVQLNNLRIQNVDSLVTPAIVSAYHDLGIQCRKFQTEDSVVSIDMPCPLAPSVLYKIRVDADTLLLLRNRKRATIADFAVGDRINVYGFMDRDTRAIDALIMRNIDKPVVQKYIQLNNIEAVSAPGVAVPTSFTVAQKGVSPCLDYGERGTGGAVFPCPLGIEVYEVTQSLSPGAAGGSAHSAKLYPSPRKYRIHVSSETKIMDANRRVLLLKDIEVGDTLNIYGLEREKGSVNALIIRDLSKPVSSAKATLRVVVTADTISCAYPMLIGQEPVTSITAPCGILYDATVEVYNSAGTRVAKGSTQRGVAVFENLLPGTYTVIADSDGYNRGKQSVTLRAHDMQTVTLILNAENDNDISLRAHDSMDGTVGTYFQSSVEASGGTGAYSWKVTRGLLPPGIFLSKPPMPMMPCSVTEGCPELRQNSIWLSGTPTNAGTYAFTLMATDSQGSSGSETFISVIRGYSTTDLPPVIHGVSGPATLKMHEVGMWTVRASDPERGPLSYSVVWGDEAVSVSGASAEPRPARVDFKQSATLTHTYWSVGTYAPVFTVTDATGHAVTAGMTVEVTEGAILYGTLTIEPASFDLKKDVQKQIKAYYRPPMPTCPPGLGCIQVLPAVQEVDARWITSNSEIVDLEYAVSDCPQILLPNAGMCRSRTSVYAIGKNPGSAEIKAVYTLASGKILTAVAKVTVSPDTRHTVSVLAPNGGETWTKGTTQTITWRDTTPYPYPACPAGAQCAPAAPKQYDIKLISEFPPCTGTSGCPAYDRAPYTIAKSVYGFSYIWSVGRVAELYDIAPAGSYTVQVCQAGTDICDSSDSYFKIVFGVTPRLNSLSPSSGLMSTKVTLKGSGFGLSSNQINFGNGALSGISSKDGATLVFEVPEYLTPSCSDGRLCAMLAQEVRPGDYKVSVTGDGGTSNALIFTVR